jgi:hypothetical protein
MDNQSSKDDWLNEGMNNQSSKDDWLNEGMNGHSSKDANNGRDYFYMISGKPNGLSNQ